MVLDGKGAIGMLRLVVSEKGADFLYEKIERAGILRCVNFDNGQPSCIVGHVLAKLGVSGEVAESLGISGNKAVLGVAQALKVSDYEWQISTDALEVLSAAQLIQDAGGPWGEALAEAETVFAEL